MTIIHTERIGSLYRARLIKK